MTSQMATLKQENTFLARHANQSLQSLIGSIQTIEKSSVDPLAYNLEQLQFCVRQSLNYVINQNQHGFSLGKILILMENVVKAISGLSKYCDPNKDDDSFAQFLEICSEICYYISQNFEDSNNLVDLLNRLVQIVDIEMAQHLSVKNLNSTNGLDINRPYLSDFPRQIMVSEKEEINHEATVSE